MRTRKITYRFLAIFVLLSWNISYGEEKKMQLSLTERLAYSAVRIQAFRKDGEIATGTGFFFRLNDDGKKCIPVIVTNWHVVEGGDKGKFSMTLASDKDEPMDGTYKDIVLDNFEARWFKHPDPKVDLAVMPIAPLLEEANRFKLKLFFISLDKSMLPSADDLSNLTAVEEILMVGYPIGIWDSTNNLPIFRRGITATHPAKNYNGRNEFMIDAACFPGSSGSPVFLHNIGNFVDKSGGTIIGTRFKFLGILHAGPQYTSNGEIKVAEVPTKQMPVVTTKIPTNLGLVIKSNALLAFDDVFRALLLSQSGTMHQSAKEPFQPTPQ